MIFRLSISIIYNAGAHPPTGSLGQKNIIETFGRSLHAYLQVSVRHNPIGIKMAARSPFHLQPALITGNQESERLPGIDEGIFL